MSVKIRLARWGSKKRPYYHVVVADSRSPRDGRYIERIGSYNPMVNQDNPDRVKIDAERANYWLAQGALATDRVQRLMATVGLASGYSYNQQTKQDKPKAKALERLEQKKQKEQEAAEATQAPSAEPEAQE